MGAPLFSLAKSKINKQKSCVVACKKNQNKVFLYENVIFYCKCDSIKL